MPPSSLPVLPASLEALLSSATLSPLVSSFEPFPGLSVVPPGRSALDVPLPRSPPPPGSPAPPSPSLSDDTLLESAPTTTADDEEEEEDLEPDDVAEEGRASLTEEGGGNVELDDEAASVEREQGADALGTTTRMGPSTEAFGSTRTEDELVALEETELDRRAGSPAQALLDAAALRWPDKTPSFVPFGKDDGTVVTPLPQPLLNHPSKSS